MVRTRFEEEEDEERGVPNKGQLVSKGIGGTVEQQGGRERSGKGGEAKLVGNAALQGARKGLPEKEKFL